MKMGNHMLNLGTHSSFFPLLWNLFSQFVPIGSETCQEYKERTIQSCIEQAKAREADKLKGTEKSDKDYFNVKGMPIDILVYISKVCPERSLLDIFPGGPLHYLLGVNTVLDWLDKMLPGFVEQAIEAPKGEDGEGGLGLKSSDRRGKSDHPGNHCKKIIKNTDHLRCFLPSFDDIQEIRQKANEQPNSAMSLDVCNRFEAALKAVDILEVFNTAHRGTTKPPVNQFNLEPFAKLEQEFKDYEVLHRKVEPSSTGRNLITPKLRAFCTLVPKFCEMTGRNMYHVNEQAGEAIHVRCQKEETNLPSCLAYLVDADTSRTRKRKRVRGPSFGTRSGVQHERADKEEAADDELRKLSSEKARLMDSLYAKSEKAWSVSALKAAHDGEDPPSTSSSTSSFPPLKSPCPDDKVVRYRGNTKMSKKVHLWSLQKLARKSFPHKSRDRLRECAERALSGDTSTPPWLKPEWQNYKVDKK